MFPLHLRDKNNINTIDIEKIYTIFKNDFIINPTYLTDGTTNYIIDVDATNTCPCKLGNNPKPKTFWHIITKKLTNNRLKNNPCLHDTERNRTYCGFRASRIPWIKYTIDNFQNNSIVEHYYEENGKKLILLLSYQDFLVIIKKIHGTSRYLVTSYIIHTKERNGILRKLKKYNDKKPLGVEWF